MTYLSTTGMHSRPTTGVPGGMGRHAFGGFMEEVAAKLEENERTQCLAKANEASAPLTAKRIDLAKNWNPTGFYTVAQIETVIGQAKNAVVNAMGACQSALADAKKMPKSNWPSILQNELSIATRRMGGDQPFIDAANRVKAHGSGVVDAPGLKAWVLSMFAAADDCVTAAAMYACMKPWWGGVFQIAAAAFNVAWNVVKGVAGTIAKVGEFVAKAPTHLDTLFTVVKWGALAGGALFAFKKFQDYKKRG